MRCAHTSSCSIAAARKRVRRAQQHTASFRLQPARQLPDRGGLARPVHAHHHDDGGRLGHLRHRPLGRFQHFQEVLADQALELAGIAHQVARDTFTDSLQDLSRGLGADVGRDQRVLQLLQNLGVDLLAPADGVFELLHQPGARLLHAGFQTF